MTRNPTHEELRQLEALVDGIGLHEVATALMNICFDKAEHVLTNWQDQDLAKEWTHKGNILEGIWDKL